MERPAKDGSYGLTFLVATPTEISLSGIISSRQGFGEFEHATARVSLTQLPPMDGDSTATIFNAIVGTDENSANSRLNIAESFALAPGNYHFATSGRGGTGAGASNQLTLQLLAVPEPGTALTTSLGLLALSALRRNRKRADRGPNTSKSR